MQLHTLGLDYTHDSDFFIDRPNGSGDELILIFKTPALVQLESGMQSVQANSAIVFSSEFHQRYGADGCEYINHWVHFEGAAGSGFAERTGLPFNTIIPVSDIAATENILRLLSLESVSNGANKDENTDLLLRLLLSKLAEGAEHGSGSSHGAKLRELRARIYRHPSYRRSIAELAADLSLSPSHFQYLYKQEFGISCHEDVITARLDMAKYYLRSTSLPIKQIAELCGCDNDVHFIRQFRKRTGMTAGEYRKNAERY
ncbi:MAG: helix-turn-helix transcriptional regulator [Oscillospiraceae bacterium]|nr:helix-turn-helix transcriptional regulator [Oscillospiraceae bacterium]